MKKSIRTAGLMLAGLATAIGLSACTSATAENAAQTMEQLEKYNQSQPVPVFDHSAARDVLKKIVSARANGEASTTFFFNLGVVDPIMTCASKGVPLASTTQLTSPDRVDSSTTVAMMEPDGIYVGESQGTWVICVDSAGNERPVYWEGNVQSQLGTAIWDSTSHSIILK